MLSNVSADTRNNSSPYGVLAFLSWNHDWNNRHFGETADLEKVARLMKEAGIRWVRMDFLWVDIEPHQGEFDFSNYDRIVSVLDQYDIAILGLLNYNPSWTGEDWNKAPDAEAYVKYARATVKHFKKSVTYWEVWNEPDHPNYWQPQDQLVAYSELLKVTAPAIREENPQAKVVMGGLSKDFPFNLKTIYRLAGKESFDIISIHPFVDPLNPKWKTILRGIVISTKRIMDEFQDGDKEIWFTEIGSPGVEKADSKATWWIGKATNAKEQAAFLKEIIPFSLEQPNVKKVFWAFLRDTGTHFGNAIDSFGLLREDMSTKAAYDEYKALTTK